MINPREQLAALIAAANATKSPEGGGASLGEPELVGGTAEEQAEWSASGGKVAAPTPQAAAPSTDFPYVKNLVRSTLAPGTPWSDKNEHGEALSWLDVANKTPLLGPAGEGIGRAVQGWSEYTRPQVAKAASPVTRDAPPGSVAPPTSDDLQGSGSASASQGLVEAPQIKAEQAGYIGDAEFRKAAAMELDAINQRLAVEAEVATKQAEAAVAKQALEETYASTLADRESLVAEERDRLSANYNNAVAELGRIDPTLDPNRYWASKSTEQKISGFLAAALFGFAGKGLDFLSMVQQEIDRDIDMQKAEFTQRRSLAQDKVAGAKGAYDMMMARVNDDRLARASIRSARLTALDQQIATIAANAKPAGVKAAAAAARAGVQRELAKSKLEVDRVNAGTANHNATLRQQAAIQNAQLKAAHQMAVAASKAGPKLEKGFSQEQSKVSELRSTIMGIREDMKGIRKVPFLAKLMDTAEPDWALRGKQTAANVLSGIGIKAPADFMNNLMAHKAATKSLALRLYHSVAGVLSDAEKQQALDLYNRGGVNSESDLVVLMGMVKKLERDHDSRIITARDQNNTVGLNALTTEPKFGGGAYAPPMTSQGPATPASDDTDEPQEGGDL